MWQHCSRWFRVNNKEKEAWKTTFLFIRKKTSLVMLDLDNLSKQWTKGICLILYFYFRLLFSLFIIYGKSFIQKNLYMVLRKFESIISYKKCSGVKETLFGITLVYIKLSQKLFNNWFFCFRKVALFVYFYNCKSNCIINAYNEVSWRL